MTIEFITYIVIERSWVNVRRASEQYRKGVDELLQFAFQNGKPLKGTYYCLCIHCLNQTCHELGETCDHLSFVLSRDIQYEYDTKKY